MNIFASTPVASTEFLVTIVDYGNKMMEKINK